MLLTVLERIGGFLRKPFIRFILLIFTCLLLLAAVFFVYRIDPSENRFGSVCSFYSLTGFYCAGCGMTRAIHQAMHGHFGVALSYNLLWPFISLFILFVLSMWFFFLCTGKNPFHPVNLFLTKHARLGWIVVIVLLSFWFFRNIPVYPFTLLAP